MKQKFYKILTIFIKNILSFLIGGSLGILFTIIFAEPFLKFAINKDVGLGIIALAPVVLLFYLLFFTVLGGILGVFAYNIIKNFKQK